jgi:hypothetical protein
MAETALFEQQKKTQPSLQETIARYKSAVRTYWKELLGAAGGWFLLDVTFYSNGLFSTQLLKTFEVEEPGVKATDHQILIGSPSFFSRSCALSSFSRTRTRALTL